MDLFFTDKYGIQLKEDDEVIILQGDRMIDAICKERVGLDTLVCLVKGSKRVIIADKENVYSQKYFDFVRNLAKERKNKKD